MRLTKPFLTLLILLFFVKNLTFGQKNPVKGETITFHNYYVHIGEKIREATHSALGDAAKALATDIAKEGDLEVDQNLNVDGRVSIVPFLYEDFWNETQHRFSDELGINFSPLDKLDGKISYRGAYPNTLRLKKALKKAKGEKFYASLMIYMEKGGFGVNVSPISLGGKLKPRTSITFVLANAKGKILDEIKLKNIKTDIVVTKVRAKVGAIHTGKADDLDVIRARMNEVYKNALDQLIAEFKKNHKKEYKKRS